MGYWWMLSFLNIAWVVPGIAYFCISLFEFIGFFIAGMTAISGNGCFGYKFCTTILADLVNSDIRAHDQIF